eukprot:175196-Rhodomonas_salina.1
MFQSIRDKLLRGRLSCKAPSVSKRKPRIRIRVRLGRDGECVSTYNPCRTESTAPMRTRLHALGQTPFKYHPWARDEHLVRLPLV